MTDNNEKISQLAARLDALSDMQFDFSREISRIRFELTQLKNAEGKPFNISEEIKPELVTIKEDFDNKMEHPSTDVKPFQQQIRPVQVRQSAARIIRPAKGKSDLEKFIGENLINKIGIAITVIGVAIGAKYSIDNDLIIPLTRIILGYLFGIGLLGFGIKLKGKYENFSAVLVGGAMSILYLITYAAYGLYNLIPQLMAFALMLIFTVFTVVAALNYNRQIIAHIGLVGAYAVPFLLSDGSGKVAVLFSYMAMINIGILAIAFRKYWKLLCYVSFGVTWLIFLAWYVTKYQNSEHFGLALIFSALFFAIFYLTFLAYKLIGKENFVIDDIILLLINSFIFYGIGYSILSDDETGKQLLGLFTLANAVIHFLVSVIIYRKKLADKNIRYLIAGLVLVFLTIAIPVQLDGNWVTLMWAGEAALLFWIGRTKNVLFYERLSYPLMLLAFFSLIQDWAFVYDSYILGNNKTRIPVILNVNFLSSVLFILAFGFINYLNQKQPPKAISADQNALSKFVSFAIPAILIFTIYYALRLEIETHWNQLYTVSAIKIKSGNAEYPEYYWNNDLISFKTIWVINYTLLFVSILSFVNLEKIKNRHLRLINLSLIIISLFVFLTLGLYYLSELRENYLGDYLSQYYQRGKFNLWFRYVSFSFVALALFSCYKCVREDFNKRNLKMAFELLLHTTILWIVSSELINWMDIFKSEQSYKLGLSILWGIYSLFLTALGIRKKNKPMRISAIALFGITLIKLFFYDISQLNTISKTIVFVSLGILLLIISFLYNKYKHLISEDETDN